MPATSSRILYRAAELGEVDETKRQATYVAATERPCAMYGGAEVLRMAGVKLERYAKNPVFLDSHDVRAGAVIGRCEVSHDTAKRQLIAVVTYGDWPLAEERWQQVKGGFLRAVSIGYDPIAEETRFIAAGEEDGEGEARVVGPAYVVGAWILYEISQVGVPADEDALRRSFYSGVKEKEMQYANLPVGEKKPEETRAKAEAPNAEAPPVAAVVETVDDVAEQRARAEHRARILRRAAVIEEVRQFAPRYDEVVDAIFLASPDATVEEAREILLKHHEELHKPVGTPPPAEIVNNETQAEAPKADNGASFSQITKL